MSAEPSLGFRLWCWLELAGCHVIDWFDEKREWAAARLFKEKNDG